MRQVVLAGGVGSAVRGTTPPQAEGWAHLRTKNAVLAVEHPCPQQPRPGEKSWEPRG